MQVGATYIEHFSIVTISPTDQYAVSSMVRQGEHVFVMEALTMHSTDPDVVAYGFQTLQIIARWAHQTRLLNTA